MNICLIIYITGVVAALIYTQRLFISYRPYEILVKDVLTFAAYASWSWIGVLFMFIDWQTTPFFCITQRTIWRDKGLINYSFQKTVKTPKGKSAKKSKSKKEKINDGMAKIKSNSDGNIL